MLKLLLWVFLFPVMLPVWAFRTGKPLLGVILIVGFVIVVVCAPDENSTPNGTTVTAPASERGSAPSSPGSLIPHAVTHTEDKPPYKISYNVRVDLVDGRLPTPAELEAISRMLRGRKSGRESTFVMFYLPGMADGEGAYASAHWTPELSVMVYPELLPSQYRGLYGAPKAQEAPRTPTTTENGTTPGGASSGSERHGISIVAHETSSRKLSIDVQTTLPGRNELSVLVSLAGQELDATWVGVDGKIVVQDGRGRASLDVSELPASLYEVEVGYYPSWSPQDSQARRAAPTEQFTTTQTVTLRGNGSDARTTVYRKENQRWVMDNVHHGYSWRSEAWTSRFGHYTELSVDRGNPEILKAYYFPSIDMTIIVNDLKGQVDVWRVGKAHH